MGNVNIDSINKVLLHHFTVTICLLTWLNTCHKTTAGVTFIDPPIALAVPAGFNVAMLLNVSFNFSLNYCVCVTEPDTPSSSVL